MNPIHKKFTIRRIRRIATARQKGCFIEIFEHIVQHEVEYMVNSNGVVFNLSPLLVEVVRQIDEIFKRCEQRKVASGVLPP